MNGDRHTLFITICEEIHVNIDCVLLNSIVRITIEIEFKKNVSYFLLSFVGIIFFPRLENAFHFSFRNPY
jgi:hypothetical protein